MTDGLTDRQSENAVGVKAKLQLSVTGAKYVTGL